MGTCTCTTNPSEHEHRMLRPLTVAALVGRPFKTVESWYLSGALPHVGRGQRGQLKVCVCCAAQLATSTSVRWVKRARRRTGRASRRVAA